MLTRVIETPGQDELSELPTVIFHDSMAWVGTKSLSYLGFSLPQSSTVDCFP